MSKLTLSEIRERISTEKLAGQTLQKSTFTAKITDVYGEEAVAKSGKPYTKIVVEMLKQPRSQAVKWSMPSFLKSTAEHLEVLEVGKSFIITIEPVGQGLQMTSVIPVREEQHVE